MTENKIKRPAILVDIKKYRIRISKKTLLSLGNPDNVLLLVNPEERSLAILRCDRSDPQAHHISWTSLANKKPFELYSRSLVESLRDISNGWQNNQSYRMYGEIISNGGVAQFHMVDSVLVNGAQF